MKIALFVSDVYPGTRTDEDNRKAATERRSRKWNARVYDTFPIRDWDRWLDDRRPSLFVQELAGSAKDVLAGSQLVAGPGFAGQWGSGSDSIAATWTPDGQSIVFVATANRHEAAFADVVQSLWLVPAGGGEPRRLTNDTDSYGAPAFSGDGRLLLASVTPKGEKVYSLARLARWNWPVLGVRQVVTATWDRSVGAFDVAPDNRAVYMLAEDEGPDHRAPREGLGDLRRSCPARAGGGSGHGEIRPRASVR